MLMKTYIILLFVLIYGSLSAQKPLDTLYANDRTTVSLFFPEPIRQGITGAAHFVFTYNPETPQYLGLLKAMPGAESNLLVLTTDGQVYSYILKYCENLPELNYFIGKQKSIGHEEGLKPEKDTPRQEQTSRDTLQIAPNRKTGIIRLCQYLIRQDKRITSRKRKKLKLTLKQVVHRRGEVYVSLELENKSVIDYELDYIRLYVENGNNKKNASYQKILHEPVYTHQVPEVVRSKERKRFVLVFPKFTLGKQENLLIEMGERNGHRVMEMRE